MDDYGVAVRRVLKFTIYFLSFSLLGYAFTEFKLVFAGLTLGAAISLINTIYTARKVLRLGDVAVSGENKRVSLGTPTRIATSLLAVMIALRYPSVFDVYFTIMGLFVAQVIAFIDGIYLHIKTTSERSRKG